jgi:hypothetical protein
VHTAARLLTTPDPGQAELLALWRALMEVSG